MNSDFDHDCRKSHQSARVPRPGKYADVLMIAGEAGGACLAGNVALDNQRQ